MYIYYAAWALKRGFLTAKAARPDVYRAANNILRVALEGRLCLCLCPPGYTLHQGWWRCLCTCIYICLCCNFLFGLLMLSLCLFLDSPALFAKDQMYMYTLQILRQIFTRHLYRVTWARVMLSCVSYFLDKFHARDRKQLYSAQELACMWPKLHVWLVGCV